MNQRQSAAPVPHFLNTYAREHVRDRRRDLDAQQSGNTQEEAEHPGNHAAVHKSSAIPFCGTSQEKERPDFSIQKDERRDHDCRT